MPSRVRARAFVSLLLLPCSAWPASAGREPFPPVGVQ